MKLFDNIWLKVIAIAAGLVLWFHVVTEKVYHHRLQLPITEIVLDEKLTLMDAPLDSLMVVVHASGKQLLRKKWRERGVKIHAVQLPTGHHNINLTTANVSLFDVGNLVTLDEVVSPTSLRLYIDHQSEMTVKVTPDINPVPDEGFAVSKISSPEPSEVTLIGARSLVRRHTTVSTIPKELTGLRNNLTLTLPLVKPPGYRIELQPDSVTVTVEIVAVKTRIFEDVPIVVYNAPPNKKALTFPATLRIELTGPPEEIDDLDRSTLIASADFRLIDSNGLTSVKVDCPSHFKVKKISADAVRIIVQ